MCKPSDFLIVIKQLSMINTCCSIWPIVLRQHIACCLPLANPVRALSLCPMLCLSNFMWHSIGLERFAIQVKFVTFAADHWPQNQNSKDICFSENHCSAKLGLFCMCRVKCVHMVAWLFNISVAIRDARVKEKDPLQPDTTPLKDQPSALNPTPLLSMTISSALCLILMVINICY